MVWWAWPQGHAIWEKHIFFCFWLSFVKSHRSIKNRDNWSFGSQLHFNDSQCVCEGSAALQKGPCCRHCRGRVAESLPRQAYRRGQRNPAGCSPSEFPLDVYPSGLSLFSQKRKETAVLHSQWLSKCLLVSTADSQPGAAAVTAPLSRRAGTCPRCAWTWRAPGCCHHLSEGRNGKRKQPCKRLRVIVFERAFKVAAVSWGATTYVWERRGTEEWCRWGRDSLKPRLDPLPWIWINKSRRGEGVGHFTGESSKRLLCHMPLTPAGFELSLESPVFTTEREGYLVVFNAWPLLNIFAAC